MKSHPLSDYVRLALMATVVSLMTACAHVRDDYDPYPYHAPRETYYDYWYYPAIGSYYDTRTRHYIYFEHDRWARARALPPHLRPHIGRHVTIRSPHDQPYQQHQRHREQYAPERYKESLQGGRGNDVWRGPSRKEIPARDRDDRYREFQDRNRNGKLPMRDRNGDRVPSSVQKDSRMRDPESRPQQSRSQQSRPHQPNTRFQATPDRREPPASAAPVRRAIQMQERDIRKKQEWPGYGRRM